jgi:hypothetical protein
MCALELPKTGGIWALGFRPSSALWSNPVFRQDLRHVRFSSDNNQIADVARGRLRAIRRLELALIQASDPDLYRALKDDRVHAISAIHWIAGRRGNVGKFIRLQLEKSNLHSSGPSFVPAYVDVVNDRLVID